MAAEEGAAGGYILDGGNIIPIDLPKIDTLNKYAYDVIKMQVKDYEEWPDDEEDAHFENLKGSLMSVLERNSLKSKPGKSIKES